MNNKLIKIVSVALILILGGCGILENKNTREYMEKHFSYLEKVYPTRNVEELFEKFPNGVKINHSISEENPQDQSLDVSYFELTVDSKQKRIYGTEKKINIDDKTTEVYKEDVIYEDRQIKYINNTTLQSRPIRFLFEQIGYQEFKSFEMRRVRYEYQQPSYFIGYWVPLNKYDFIDVANQKIYVSIRDYGRGNAHVELGNSELSYSIIEQLVEGSNE